MIEKVNRRIKFMEKIASFTIDHIKLQPGIYVSRKDHIGAETISKVKASDVGVMTAATISMATIA